MANFGKLKASLQQAAGDLRHRFFPDIWTDPVAGRKIMAVDGSTTVRGYQTIDGKVIITSIEHLQRHPQPGVTAAVRDRHYMYVQQAREEATGEYTWAGQTEPVDPVIDLSAILGKPVANIWREEAQSWSR
jgi:hypothetical protein